MNLYVYAIAEASEQLWDLPKGITEQPVYQTAAGPLAAFVSDYPGTTIRAERRHIAASQSVLRALQAKIDLLPMAFGTLTHDVDGVAELLTRRRDALLGQLDRVGGAVEMGVRVSLEVSDPIAYLVETSEQLRLARDRTFGRGRTPSHEDKLRLGQLCESALRNYQQSHAARLIAHLKPFCSEISALPTNDDRQVANLAVLVPRAAVDAFETAVNAAADSFDDSLAFNLSGPWPPHNFVELKL